MVVGGGPSGSTCARDAALRGLDVVLIEQAAFPRDKLCGGALSPRVSSILDFDISSVIERPVHCAAVHAPSGRKFKVVRKDVTGHTVKRRNFDNYLLQKASEAGAEIVENTKVFAIEHLKSSIRILSHGDSFRSHLLVGADGVNSTIARESGIRKGWPPQRVALSIAADIPMDPDEIERILGFEGCMGLPAIELYLWAIQNGYGWCFPKRDEINLGLGYMMKHQIENLRVGWKAFLQRFEEEKGVHLDTSNQSAFRVPLGRLDLKVTSRRTMLVGDAAGLVSPITGEGIYYAIRSGQIAAQVAVETVKGRNPYHVAQYERRLKKEFGTEFSAANFASGVAYKSERNVELLCQLAVDDLVLQNLIIDLALGVRSISSIRMDITKHMLRHYPLKSLRLLA